jgi:hypothetical protein
MFDCSGYRMHNPPEQLESMFNNQAASDNVIGEGGEICNSQ